MSRFSGLVAAGYTPMHEDETLAPELIAPLLDYAAKQKYAGLFITGSTGEFTALTTAERKLVTEVYLKENAGRTPIIVNAGSCSFEESRELIAHAVKLGADAVCLMCPFYFRPETVRDLADFVKKCAPACEGTPLFLYYAPSITYVKLPMHEFLNIMAEEVPNFAGLKFTNEDLCEYQRCIEVSPKFDVMFGRDEMLLGALATGARAAVGTTFNYLPRIYRGVIDAFHAGDMPEARRFMSLSHKAVKISARYGLPSIKLFMKFAGIDVGPMRSPVGRISAEAEKQFRRELSLAGLDEYIG